MTVRDSHTGRCFEVVFLYTDISLGSKKPLLRSCLLFNCDFLVTVDSDNSNLQGKLKKALGLGNSIYQEYRTNDRK